MTAAVSTAPAARTRTPAESLDRAGGILGRYGRDEVTDLARRRFGDTSHARTVVVLGEVSRGKSLLIGALLGRRDLLPSGLDPTTGVPVRVRAHAAAVPEEHLTLHGPWGDEDRPRAELAGWSRLGNTGADDARLPTGIGVDVGGTPFDDVVVVDTPGAGGLDESAVDMALAEAGRAGILLLVVEASTPITAGEMEILRRAHTEVGHVVVVVTKTDKNLRRRHVVRAETGRLVAEHLGLHPPVIGVSSLRALDAECPPGGAAADPEVRAQRLERSGMPELRRAVATGLALGDGLAVVSGLRTARDGLRAVVAEVEAELAGVRDAESALPDLEARQAELTALREHSQQWEQYLARNLSLARTRIAADTDARLEEIKRRWTDRINAAGISVLRSRPQIFTAQIEAEYARVLGDAVGAVLAALEGETARLFPLDPTVWPSIVGPTMTTLVPPSAPDVRIAKKTENLLDPAVVSMGVIGAGLLTAVIPFAPVAGGVWVGVNLAYRAMKNGKQALITWLRETTGTTRTSAMRLVDTALATARPEVVVRYRSALRAESEAVQARIDGARRAARQDADQRAATVTRLEKNARIIRATIDELDAHCAAVEARR